MSAELPFEYISGRTISAQNERTEQRLVGHGEARRIAGSASSGACGQAADNGVGRRYRREPLEGHPRGTGITHPARHFREAMGGDPRLSPTRRPACSGTHRWTARWQENSRNGRAPRSAGHDRRGGHDRVIES